MKGDFTRSTFNSKKHYRRVKMQQGRVQVDADWNEQTDIDFHYQSASLRDLIGATGTPIDNVTGEGDGFKIIYPNPITTDYTTDYLIKKGHYYVDGILCENEEDVSASQQNDLPIFTGPRGTLYSPLPPNPGVYLVYLDVWERHLTYLDDDLIRDVALLGPDTATRAKIVWQVKVLKVDESPGDPTPLCNIPLQIGTSDGTLRARAQPTQQSKDPCVLPPQAGYRGLGTQLYRVEISDPGYIAPTGLTPTPTPTPTPTAIPTPTPTPTPTPSPASTPPTFKWSRDNGSVVSKVLAIDETNSMLTVNSTGRDDYLGFAKGVWAEIIDDRCELWGIPGTFVRIIDVEEKTLGFDPKTLDADLVINIKKQEFNPKIRRWDGANGIDTASIPSINSGYIELENGVEIKFEEGKHYATGDYWLIRASSATVDTTSNGVEWANTQYEIQWDGLTAAGSDDEALMKKFLMTNFEADWVASNSVHFLPDATDSSNIIATATNSSGATHSLSLKINNENTTTLTIDDTVVYVFLISQQDGENILHGSVPDSLPPIGIKHHYAKLAVMEYQQSVPTPTPTPIPTPIPTHTPIPTFERISPRPRPLAHAPIHSRTYNYIGLPVPVRSCYRPDSPVLSGWGWPGGIPWSDSTSSTNSWCAAGKSYHSL